MRRFLAILAIVAGVSPLMATTAFAKSSHHSTGHHTASHHAHHASHHTSHKV